MDSYDVVVIGAGNAGQGAAGVCAAAGKSTCIVEARDVGGTCPLRGCVPKKVLVAASEVVDVVSRASVHGVHVAPAKLDWEALIARKRTFVEGVPAAMERDLAKKGVALTKGRARFVARNAIEVAGRRIEGRAFVVATGSKPRVLPFPGAELAITSDDFLELPSLPRSVAFVGAGVVAFEFAHVLARAGAKVTLLESLPRALPMFDEDAAKVLVDATRALGIDVVAPVKVRAIEARGDRRLISYENGSEQCSLEVDLVVHGAGRVADLDELDLELAGVTRAGNGAIEVDAHLRSKGNPIVFVAGDAVIGAPQLSAVATYEGKLVGHNLTREPQRAADYRCIPSVVFTTPPLASVGETDAQARKRGAKTEVRVNDMRAWRSARTYAETTAWSKIVLESGTDRILGAQIVGHGGQETIHAIALAMAARPDDARKFLADFVFAYPTFHSDLKSML